MGARILVYSWEAFTQLHRRGSYIVVKRTGIAGGHVQRFDKLNRLEFDDYVRSDENIIRNIAKWCLSLGDRLALEPYTPTVERDIARIETKYVAELAEILNTIRAGKTPTYFTLPDKLTTDAGIILV